MENIRQEIEKKSKSLADTIVNETYLKVFESLKNNFKNVDYQWVGLRLETILTKELVLDTIYYKDCISYLSAQISNIEGFRGCNKKDIKSKMYETIISLNSKEPAS